MPPGKCQPQRYVDVVVFSAGTWAVEVNYSGCENPPPVITYTSLTT